MKPKVYIFKCGCRTENPQRRRQDHRYECAKCGTVLFRIEIECIDCGKIMTVKPQASGKQRCYDCAHKFAITKMRNKARDRRRARILFKEVNPKRTRKREILTEKTLDDVLNGRDLRGWEPLKEVVA